MNDGPRPFPIVGVGASAGGVEALKGFFLGLPSAPPLAVIVVTHLSPDHDSKLPEVIAHYTDRPVKVAEHDERIQAGVVYVTPPDVAVSLQSGTLKLIKLSGTRHERKLIDFFFSALALDQGDYAASVVLSGGDGDGTLGTKAIKDRGGLTLAQTPDAHGPRHPSMPQSAIAANLVDFALPAQDMGAKLADFAQALADPALTLEDEDDRVFAARLEICAILRTQLGHDFSGYKTRTILRRVKRRMQVCRSASISTYVDRLSADPSEVQALFRDLLINVTTFFRDAEAFEVLKDKVIPKLFEGKKRSEAVRVWVPGCSTGEEVYSIAILLCEHMRTLNEPSRAQIFATDIDEHALAAARAGCYPQALLDAVSAERKARYFTQDAGSYVLTKEVRDLCIFSPQSVIRDPPFSRLDLISCRNLLIYFGQDVQSEVLPTFHYSLRDGGYLFLGLSENVSQFSDLFAPLDKKNRIFRSREKATTSPQLPKTAAGHPSPKIVGAERRYAPGLETGAHLRQMLAAQVADHFAPSHVLATPEGDIVHFSGGVGRYLEIAQGAPTRQLLALARKGLRLDLRSALREAAETRRQTVRSGLAVADDEGRLQMVRLVVEPLLDRGDEDPLLIVVFLDEGPRLSREDALARFQTAPDNDADIHLERELRDTRDRLQSLIEEYETALEELKSSNEELLSVNEELQSSNEEMEASKEELQSLNEELNTVNSELNIKIDALDQAHSDLQGLFESTQIPTVFLDNKLIIRTFTPAVRDLFNILPGDCGRPITDLTSRLPLPGFVDDLEEVLRSSRTLERQLSREGGGKYLLRSAPCRNADAQIEGVVFSFLDVTGLASQQDSGSLLIDDVYRRLHEAFGSASSGAAAQADPLSPEALAVVLVQRVRAIEAALGVLSASGWGQGDVASLLRAQLAPFGLSRADLEGPGVSLPAVALLALGSSFAELLAHGMTRGALLHPDARLAVRWTQAASGVRRDLKIAWRERGVDGARGAALSGPQRDALQREIFGRLGGSVTLRLGRRGYNAALTVPL